MESRRAVFGSHSESLWKYEKMEHKKGILIKKIHFNVEY